MDAGGALRGTGCWEVQARAKGHSSPRSLASVPALSAREERLILKGIASSGTLRKTFRNEQTGKRLNKQGTYYADWEMA